MSMPSPKRTYDQSPEARFNRTRTLFQRRHDFAFMETFFEKKCWITDSNGRSESAYLTEPIDRHGN